MSRMHTSDAENVINKCRSPGPQGMGSVRTGTRSSFRHADAWHERILLPIDALGSTIAISGLMPSSTNHKNTLAWHGCDQHDVGNVLQDLAG